MTDDFGTGHILSPPMAPPPRAEFVRPGYFLAQIASHRACVCQRTSAAGDFSSPPGQKNSHSNHAPAKASCLTSRTPVPSGLKSGQRGGYCGFPLPLPARILDSRFPPPMPSRRTMLSSSLSTHLRLDPSV